MTDYDLSRLAGSAPTRATVAEPPRRWKTRVLLPGLILATIAGLVLVTSARTLLPATPVRVVPVVVKTVAGTSGSVTVQAPGWLEPDPHPYYVAALADGVVAELFALEGDRVEADEVIARLVDDDARLALARAEAALAQEQAARRAAVADVQAARLDLEHLVEPTRAVALAEAALGAATAAVGETRAKTVVERARLLELQDEYDRKAQLTESQAVSEAAVARLALRIEGQRATIEAARAREVVLDARGAQAEADLRAARTDLRLLIDERRAVAIAEAALARVDGSVALAEAVRDEAALRLDRMQIRAPIGGIVLRRLASPGSKVVGAGGEYSAHVYHLYDPRRLQVRVDIPLAEAAHVAVGQRAEITVDVLPDHVFAGVVTRLVHTADIQKNTVEVKVAMDEPTTELKPEMLARVRLLAVSAPGPGSAESVRQRLFAPTALVGDGSEGVALVVASLVDQRGRVERRAIVAGAKQIDGWVEIESGLRVGDLLIADPAADLQPGDRIRVIGEGG